MSDSEKTYEPALCAACEGFGCMVCNKTGTVLVTAPRQQCPQCEGAGCIYCGYTGWAGPKGKYD